MPVIVQQLFLCLSFRKPHLYVHWTSLHLIHILLWHKYSYTRWKSRTLGVERQSHGCVKAGSLLEKIGVGGIRDSHDDEGMQLLPRQISFDPLATNDSTISCCRMLKKRFL